MAKLPDPEILQLVIAFALKQLNGEQSQRLSDRVAVLIGDASEIKSWGEQCILLTSPTRAEVIRVRAVLKLAFDTRVVENSYWLPLPKNRTIILPIRPRNWPVLARSLIWAASCLLVLSGRLTAEQTTVYLAFVLLAGGWGLSIARNRSRAHLNLQSLLKTGLVELRNHQERLALADKEQQHFNTVRDLLPEAEYQFRHTADLAAVYAHLITFLRRLFPEADGISIWILDESGEHLELVHATGRHFRLLTPRSRHAKNLGATGYALQTQRPYFVVDFMNDPYALPYLHGTSDSGLAIPLFTSESPIGAAMLSGMARGLSPDHRTWAAEVLAGLAALRVQSLSERSRAQKLVDDFARLHDLVAWKSGEAHPTNLLERFAAHLQAASGANVTLTYYVGPGERLEPGPIIAPTAEIQAWLSKMPSERTPVRLILAGSGVQAFGAEDLQQLDDGPFRASPANACVGIPITRGDGVAVAVVLLLYIGSTPVLPGPDLMSLYGTYARYAGISIHNLELYATTVGQSYHLRQLLSQVVKAQEAERRRIAIDLHDWLVQGLAAPAFQLQIAARLLDPSQTMVREELQSAHDQLRIAGDELRLIMKGLRPYLLDELGLIGAVQAYAADWSRSQRIASTVTNDPKARLPRGSEEGLAAFRIIQEALNNVAKHSGATHVEITISRAGGMAHIRIQDDGKGFEPSQSVSQEHFGLLGMHERATSVGGHLEVSQSPEGGCLVICSIPMGT